MIELVCLLQVLSVAALFFLWLRAAIIDEKKHTKGK